MLTSVPECKECALYREWLEKESIEKRHLQALLFKKVGLIDKANEEELDEADWPVVQRGIRLSELRRHLESQSRRNVTPGVQAPEARVATPSELTEAERLFEEKLNEVQQTPVQQA